MRLRFSIAALIWFTAIVAFAAGLPRQWHHVAAFPDRPGITRENWPLGWELQWRGAIVVILCLVVWLLTRRDKGLPP